MRGSNAGTWWVDGNEVNARTRTHTLVTCNPSAPRALTNRHRHRPQVVCKRKRYSIEGNRFFFLGADPGPESHLARIYRHFFRQRRPCPFAIPTPPHTTTISDWRPQTRPTACPTVPTKTPETTTNPSVELQSRSGTRTLPLSQNGPPVLPRLPCALGQAAPVCARRKCQPWRLAPRRRPRRQARQATGGDGRAEGKPSMGGPPSRGCPDQPLSAMSPSWRVIPVVSNDPRRR